MRGAITWLALVMGAVSAGAPSLREWLGLNFAMSDERALGQEVRRVLDAARHVIRNFTGLHPDEDLGRVVLHLCDEVGNSTAPIRASRRPGATWSPGADILLK